MAYCFLVLFGNWLQKQVFGELRVSELQHIKDKFWNFVFYKFIFIFGIKNVQSMEGVILWGSWFSVIGFLHIHAQLCQDRFEYVIICYFFILDVFESGFVIQDFCLAESLLVIYDSLYSSTSTLSPAHLVGIDTGVIRSIVFDLPGGWSTSWMGYIFFGRPGMSSLGFAHHPRYR
jgi:hypothetical protein